MKRKKEKLSDQVKDYANEKPKKAKAFEGNSESMISTGSTLLDLAISGGRIKHGGIPSGILVEIFGPNSSGKTTLLCEIAGNIQRQGGEVKFMDPEGRLNAQYASMFGLEIDFDDKDKYQRPDTVPEVFEPLRKWEPKPSGRVHGVFADSLAALSTDMEMEAEDKYGMRKAKELSEHLRKTCRVLPDKNILMVCSNQIRDNINATGYGYKFTVPGGKAIGFHCSLQLRIKQISKIKRKKKVSGKDHEKIIGVKSIIEVFKSSVWEPYHVADVYIIFDYGIDDIRGNLQFLKENGSDNMYMLNDKKLGKSIDRAIREIEENELQSKLKKETIKVWNEIQDALRTERKPKVR